MPPDSAVGFAAADWVVFFVGGLLLLAAFAWRPRIRQAFHALAQRTGSCMVLLFVLPIALRLLLLPQHPVPTPETREEFSQLLAADTLWHARLANPPHALAQFFETFSVIQTPSYSSIYLIGEALPLALGRLLTGIPWSGVLMATGFLCAACYWMLRGWVTPAWALLGGVLAVIEFGPLCQWTNSYGCGSWGAIAGCLVFGALPRLRSDVRRRDAILLGAGVAMEMLISPFEALLLVLASALWMRKNLLRLLPYSAAPAAAAMLLILLQSKAVTGSWTTLPEQLSQYQYGVPASFTFRANATPHLLLTAQQQSDYNVQSVAHGAASGTVVTFLLSLAYRVRYYRFFFLAALYPALIAFLFAWRDSRWLRVAATLAIFALGTNLFPYFVVDSLAAVTCLFILVSVVGLQLLSQIRIKGAPVGTDIACVLMVLCVGEFVGWYTLHLFETPNLYSLLDYETWDLINHKTGERRLEVQRQLEAMNQPVLVFVRYTPRHTYQDEWVWNGADIDGSRIVYARDLGASEDEKLIRYYPRRKVMLLEPDLPTPQLSSYQRMMR